MVLRYCPQSRLRLSPGLTENCSIPEVALSKSRIAQGRAFTLPTKSEGCNILFSSCKLNMSIHSTAVVSKKAMIAPNVRIGPYAVIEDDVEIAPGCEVGAHAVIKQFTKIGARNRIFEHAVLGGEPQDVKFKGEPSSLVIGDDNLIREFCTLHRACGDGEATRVGSRNFIMVGVHVAHNCLIGDDNIMANDVAL